MTEENRFLDRYRTGTTPWAHQHPDFNLLEVIEKRQIKPCVALDPGCGLGVEAIWLASKGFEVTAMDISPLALDKANAAAAELGKKIRWMVMDIMTEDLPESTYDFIFDRGFFHTFDSDEERSLVARKLAVSMREDGLWLSLIGNKDGVAERTGPPLRTASDIVLAVDPYFEILSLEVSVFGSDQASPAKIWRCLMKKRS